MFCFPSMLERDPNARHLPQVNIMAVRADTMFSDTASLAIINGCNLTGFYSESGGQCIVYRYMCTYQYSGR